MGGWAYLSIWLWCGYGYASMVMVWLWCWLWIRSLEHALGSEQLCVGLVSGEDLMGIGKVDSCGFHTLCELRVLETLAHPCAVVESAQEGFVHSRLVVVDCLRTKWHMNININKLKNHTHVVRKGELNRMCDKMGIGWVWLKACFKIDGKTIKIKDILS